MVSPSVLINIIFDSYFILLDEKTMDVILDNMRSCSCIICAEAQV